MWSLRPRRCGKGLVRCDQDGGQARRVNFSAVSKGESETVFDSNVIHYKELFVHGASDSTVPQMMTILDLMAQAKSSRQVIIDPSSPLRNVSGRL